MRSATARTTGTLTALPRFALHFRQHTDSGFLFFVRLSVKSFPRLQVYQIIAEIGLFVIVTCYRSAGMGMNRVFPARMIPSTRRRERKYISGTPVCNTSDKVDSLSVLG